MPDETQRPKGTTPRELAREVWEDESPSAAATEQQPARLLDIPVGLPVAGEREEHDTLGRIDVPAHRYWGAQTQRSLEHFGRQFDRMPLEVVHAYGQVKRAAAEANHTLGRLPGLKAAAIIQACDEVCAGQLDGHFPLGVLQAGSGTHTNANVNEVVANRANQLLGSRLGSGSPVHPNDDVNLSQSTNDTFVTAMHLAAHAATVGLVAPALTALAAELEEHAVRWRDVRKVGRTHLMDAVPLSVGDEWSGYASSLVAAVNALAVASDGLYEVALGGTAVGTGLNAPPGFAALAVQNLARITGRPWRPAVNAFAAQSTLDALVRVHAALTSVAVVLFKVANDLRWMASGPYSGLGEIRVRADEPGSTIMPGKVNPTQAEAMLMACLAVFGHDVIVTSAGAEGNFELNAFRPIVISTFLRTTTLLAGTAEGFTRFVDGLTLDEDRLENQLRRSVMVVTALTPVVGYERAAAIVTTAVQQDIPPRAAAAQHGVAAEEFDQAMRVFEQT